MFEVDNFTTKGYSHDVCQDYSLGTHTSQGPILVVSDGCSSVNLKKLGQTELGTLILSNVTKKVLSENKKTNLDPEEFQKEIIQRSKNVTKELSISDDSLAATLLVAFQNEDSIHIYAYGDGIVVVEDNEGRKWVEIISYAKNMPFYPLYNSHKSYIDDYISSLKYWEEDLQSRTVERYTSSKDESNLVFHHESKSSFTDVYVSSWSIHKFKQITLFSDGIGSFVDYASTFDKIEAIQECLKFKNFKGDFVKRRASNFLKQMSKKGFNHYDDFSIGSIYNFNPKEENVQ